MSEAALQQESRTTELEALVAALNQRLTDAEKSAAGSAADLATAAGERDRALADLQVTRLHNRTSFYRLAGRSLNKVTRPASGVKDSSLQRKDSLGRCLGSQQLEMLL